MKHSLLLLFHCCLCWSTLAQYPFSYKDVFDADNGIKVEIICLEADSEGFIWIGANEGLFRFDGYRATEIRFDQSRPQPYVYDVEFDPHRGLLWVGTNQGIIKYHPQFRTFEYLEADGYFPPNEYKFGSCRKIFVDRQARVWANFAVKGLVEILDEGKSVTWHQNIAPHLEESSETLDQNANQVRCFSQDPLQDSILWIGTKAGLVRFNKSIEQFKHYYYYHPNAIFQNLANPLRCILAHTDGMIYAGSFDGGLILFDPKTERFSHHLPYPKPHKGARQNTVETIFSNGSSKIQIACMDGFFDFDTKQLTYESLGKPG